MKHDTDINLELRSAILDASLNLENAVNELLLALLGIENPKRKAITNKSGNLSFKNKIDLLFDLDILDGGEHQQLLLLMEFRNQFLHNIECNSFQKALNLLGADKEKKLLTFANTDKFTEMEGQYKCAFDNLKMECLKTIVAKIDSRINQIEDRRKILVNLAEGQMFFINKYFNIARTILELFGNKSSSSPEVFNLFNRIEKIITTDMEQIKSSEEYTKLQAEIKEGFAPEKLKELFKR